ncbi:sarcoplasmic/endoplasmic reticulum calcium ATPase regulator DWORF isoform X2 [Ambystoma mexicanum]
MAEPGEQDKVGSSRAGQIPYTQLIVPALLVAGWFVGCAVMVYVIFS